MIKLGGNVGEGASDAPRSPPDPPPGAVRLRRPPPSRSAYGSGLGIGVGGGSLGSTTGLGVPGDRGDATATGLTAGRVGATPGGEMPGTGDPVITITRADGATWGTARP